MSLLYKHEAYYIIGLCMDVHNELGKGFSEAVYAEVLEYELKDSGVPFQKEMKYHVFYKNQRLKPY